MRTGFVLLGVAGLNLVPGFLGRDAPLPVGPAGAGRGDPRRAGLALAV